MKIFGSLLLGLIVTAFVPIVDATTQKVVPPSQTDKSMAPAPPVVTRLIMTGINKKPTKKSKKAGTKKKKKAVRGKS